MEAKNMSYEDLKQSGNLGKLQAMYLAVFIEAFHHLIEDRRALTHDEATRQVAERFAVKCAPRNGRIRELEERGLIQKVDQIQIYRRNGKVGLKRWMWTGRLIPFECRTEFVPCKACDAKGGRTQKVFRKVQPATLFDRQPEATKI